MLLNIQTVSLSLFVRCSIVSSWLDVPSPLPPSVRMMIHRNQMLFYSNYIVFWVLRCVLFWLCSSGNDGVGCWCAHTFFYRSLFSFSLWLGLSLAFCFIKLWKWDQIRNCFNTNFSIDCRTEQCAMKRKRTVSHLLRFVFSFSFDLVCVHLLMASTFQLPSKLFQTTPSTTPIRTQFMRCCLSICFCKRMMAELLF